MFKIIGIVTGLAGLVAFMPEVFFNNIDPKEEYQVGVASLTLNERLFDGALNFGLLAVSVWALRRVHGQICFWACITLLTSAVIPGVVIGPLMHLESRSAIFEMNVVLTACFVGFVFACGLVERVATRIWQPSATEHHVALDDMEFLANRRPLDFAMLGAVMVGAATVVFALGINVDLSAGMDDVYVVRLFLRDVDLGLLGYIFPWVVFLGPAVIYGILGTKPLHIFAAFVLSQGVATVILMSTSVKVGIWVAVLPLLFFALRRYDFLTRMVYLICGLFVVTVVLPLIGSLDEDLQVVFEAVPRRVYYVPGVLHGLGVEIFRGLPPFGFQDLISRFTGEIVQLRYTYILGSLSGYGEQTNANVHFLLDGYINARSLGMVGVTVVAGITVGLLSALVALSRSTIGVLYVLIVGQLYAETAFQQVYLTGGVALMAIFLLVRATTADAASHDGAGVALPLLRARSKL